MLHGVSTRTFKRLQFFLHSRNSSAFSFMPKIIDHVLVFLFSWQSVPGVILWIVASRNFVGRYQRFVTILDNHNSWFLKNYFSQFVFHNFCWLWHISNSPLLLDLSLSSLPRFLSFELNVGNISSETSVRIYLVPGQRHGIITHKVTIRTLIVCHPFSLQWDLGLTPILNNWKNYSFL
jgi:hypothetical protein